jgi:hypothetical protein
VTTSRPNPLRDLANVTYGLSLRALSYKDFNDIMDNANSVKSVINKNVLIYSGGKVSSSASRSPFFIEDFFFDNFKMTTVVGLNSRTKGSNVIEMSFTIIEPYGITLINRLLKEAERLGIRRWDEMPFLMVIEFYGNTDGGVPTVIEKHTKYLPISLIDIKIKLTQQGTEYTVSAVPYTHMVHSETLATTPINMEVTAGTVKDFFDPQGGGGFMTTISQVVQSAREREEQVRNETERLRGDVRSSILSDANSRAAAEAQSKINEIKKTRFKVGSYTAALNEYYSSLETKKTIEKPDIYQFVINDEISESKITRRETARLPTTPMGDTEKINLDQTINPINAGTSIVAVINQIIRNSEYITKQVDLKNPQTDAAIDTPINWYKINTKIKLGEYDRIRKTTQKDITFYVRKYQYHNTKYPFANNSNPSSWSKEYDYIFTGKNESIIDLNIDFNTAFYVALQSFPGKIKETSGQTVDGKGIDTTTATTAEGALEGSRSPTDAAVTRVMPVSGNQVRSTATSETTDAANDLFNSVLSSARGDMINIQMKILGDPEFIKQDDILYVDTQATSRTIDEFGSLVTDASEIFVRLRFKTPSDLNQNTGLMDFETWETESSFDGLYRVMTVTTEMSKGMFVQTLDLIRQFKQNETRTESEPNGQREISTTDTRNRSYNRAPGSDSDYRTPPPPAPPRRGSMPRSGTGFYYTGKDNDTINSAPEE